MVEVTASYQITEKAKEHATVHIAFPRIQERWSYLLVKRLFDFFLRFDRTYSISNSNGDYRIDHSV